MSFKGIDHVVVRVGEGFAEPPNLKEMVTYSTRLK